jgi:hypothetical protein
LEIAAEAFMLTNRTARVQNAVPAIEMESHQSFIRPKIKEGSSAATPG